MASFSVETHLCFDRSSLAKWLKGAVQCNSAEVAVVEDWQDLTDKICNDAGALRVSTGSAACCKLVTGGDLSGGLSVLPGVVVTWDLWEFAIAYKAQSDPVGRGRLVMSLLSLTAQLCAVIFLLILSLYSDSFSFPPTEPPRQSMNCVVLKLKWRFEPPTVQYTDLFYCSSPYWYTGFMY